MLHQSQITVARMKHFLSIMLEISMNALKHIFAVYAAVWCNHSCRKLPHTTNMQPQSATLYRND